MLREGDEFAGAPDVAVDDRQWGPGQIGPPPVLAPVGCHARQGAAQHATVDQIAAAVSGRHAVVFAAGAGPGGGAARKLTMDRDGAIKLLEATAAASHYVMLSGIGAENPPDGDDVISVYLRAKAEADAAVMASDRHWTIMRPGGLTDEPGTGRARIESAPSTARSLG